MTTVEREEPNNRVEGNGGAVRDSAIGFADWRPRGGSLRGLRGVLCPGHHFGLMLIECLRAGNVVRHECLRFFSHRHRRQEQ